MIEENLMISNKIYFFLIVFYSTICYSQNEFKLRKDFILLSSNDTILNKYYWKLYDNKELGRMVVLIPNKKKNRLPRKFYLNEIHRIDNTNTFIPVCCNRIYIDNILIVPFNIKVYELHE